MKVSKIQRLVLSLAVSIGSISFASQVFAQDVTTGANETRPEAKQHIYLPLISTSPEIGQNAETNSPPVGVEGPAVTSSRSISDTYTEVVQVATNSSPQSAIVERYGTEDTVAIPFGPPNSQVFDASADTPNTRLATINITISRWIAIITKGADAPNYYAQAIGATTTDQCVGGVWAQIQHRYWGKGPTYFGQVFSQYSLNIFCFSNAQATESWILYAPGTSHVAISKHSVKIKGVWNNYYGPNNQGYQSSTVRK